MNKNRHVIIAEIKTHKKSQKGHNYCKDGFKGYIALLFSCKNVKEKKTAPSLSCHIFLFANRYKIFADKDWISLRNVPFKESTFACANSLKNFIYMHY